MLLIVEVYTGTCLYGVCCHIEMEKVLQNFRIINNYYNQINKVQALVYKKKNTSLKYQKM